MKNKEYTIDGYPCCVWYGGVGAVLSEQKFKEWKDGKYDPFSDEEKKEIDDALNSVVERISKDIDKHIIEDMERQGLLDGYKCNKK